MNCQLCDRALDSGTVCTACMQLAVRALGEIPGLTVELATTLARQTKIGPQSPGRLSDDRPLPINLRALAAGDDLRATLAFWCRYVVLARRIPGPIDHSGPLRKLPERIPGFPERVPVDRMAAWLLHHTEWLRQSDRAEEFITDVTRVTNQVRRTIDQPAEHWYAGPCDLCGADLYAKAGAVLVRCHGKRDGEPCEAYYDVAERRDWLMGQVMDRIATTGEICRALGTLAGLQVTPSVIRGLAHRGRLQARGPGRYRIGDVVALVLEQQKRNRRAS